MRIQFLAFGSFALLLACVGGGGTKVEADPMAGELWEEIQGYRAWFQHEAWSGIQSSASTHGPFVQIWYNETTATAEAGEQGTQMPAGSILVKEGYLDGEGTDLKAITVMKKVEGFDPDNGDWYWASYAADGSVYTSGASDFCSSCHAAANHDYVLFLDELPEDTGGGEAPEDTGPAAGE
jgi:hypothetical protein